jgi:heme A synthase
VTSGIALILVAILVVAVWRSRPKGDLVRLAAAAAGILIVNEALIGAMLVLFEWVDEDQSNGRALAIALHLVNTFLLLGALALTAWWTGDGARPRRPFPERERRWFTMAAVGLLLVGAAGAITALGDTLFPAESIFEGIRDDFTGTFLVRLRWIHPILAVATGLFIVWLVPRTVVEGRARRLGAAITWLVGIQLIAGIVNVALLAPVWMQLVHLFLADLLWVASVLYAVEVLAVRERTEVAA